MPLVERRIVFLGSLSSKQAQQFNSKLRLVNNYICAITRLFPPQHELCEVVFINLVNQKAGAGLEGAVAESGLAMKTARESADDEVKPHPSVAPLLNPGEKVSIRICFSINLSVWDLS